MTVIDDYAVVAYYEALFHHLPLEAEELKANGDSRSPVRDKI
jgi:hypothetical protein